MNAFNTAIASLFSDPNLAVDAIYAPTAGGTTSVRVITHNPDVIQSFGQSVIESPSLVLVAQVADCPSLAQGDEFTIAGVVYTVQGQPRRNAERLVWEVDCYAP